MNLRRAVWFAAICALVLPGCGLRATASSQVALEQNVTVEEQPTAAPEPAEDAATTVPEPKRHKKRGRVIVAQPAVGSTQLQTDQLEAELEGMVAQVEQGPAPRATPRRRAPKNPVVPDSRPAPSPPDHGRILMGQMFQSIGVTAGGEPRPLVEGTSIELRFERRDAGDVLAWNAGCNHIGGPVVVREDRLDVTAQDGTTAGCPQERHDQDEWLTAFLESDPAWTLNQDTEVLTLTSGDTRIRLRPTA